MAQYQINVGSVIEVAIEPKATAESGRLLAALTALTDEDPSLRYSQDGESGQTVLGGQSEHHLDEAVHKIMRAHGVALTIGAPQVAYRERLTRAVEVLHTHMKVVGGAGEFARVSILFEPAEPNSGFAFENATPNTA